MTSFSTDDITAGRWALARFVAAAPTTVHACPCALSRDIDFFFDKKRDID
jgi:hypothetical protein